MPVEENRIEFSLKSKQEAWEDLEGTEETYWLRHAQDEKVLD